MYLLVNRTADIIFAVDAGGQTGNGNTGTFSTDTGNPGDTPFAVCPTDTTDSFLAANCEISGQADASVTRYTTLAYGGRCCDMCSSLYAQALGCLSDNVIKNSNLVSSIANYQDKVSGSKAPTMPQSDSILGDDTLAMGQRVSGRSRLMVPWNVYLIEPFCLISNPFTSTNLALHTHRFLFSVAMKCTQRPQL